MEETLRDARSSLGSVVEWRGRVIQILHFLYWLQSQQRSSVPSEKAFQISTVVFDSTLIIIKCAIKKDKRMQPGH